jgi:carbonic anhydrase
MKTILDGVARFQRDVVPGERALLERLASSQNPEALLITCADSRIVPSLITQTRPGDLFICRNAGNIAPAYEEVTGGVSATIEYAVRVLNVQHIIVCGHSDCGAMKALLNPESIEGMRSLAAWLRHGEAARLIVQENFPELQGKALMDTLAQQNALAQIANLRTHPCVAARETSGRLTLHAWFYEVDSGRVLAYETDRRAFVPLVSNVRERPVARAMTGAAGGDEEPNV